ncbi:MAG: hypothetical protein WCG08_07960 [Paludibacter sp.]
MEKIIIFTNYNSLGFNNPNRERLKFKNTDGTEINEDFHNKFIELKFFKYNGNGQFQSVESLETGNIFFIYDEIEQKVFDTFINTNNKSKIGILWHKNDGDFSIDIADFKIQKKGQHMQNGLYYPKILEILTDGKDDEFERLKEKVFKYNPELNVAHEFLHHSIASPASIDILSSLFELDSIVTVNTKSDKLENWIKRLNEENIELKNYNALKDVRDALLSIALPEK